MINEKLFFCEHLKSACRKTSKKVSSLVRIIVNTIGPRTRERRVLEAVPSVLPYGAEIWANILKQKTGRQKIAAVQWRGALRTACAYRTVSKAAILVIAEAAPINLLAFEKAKLYDVKNSDENMKDARTKIKMETQQE
ncbi:uncharacterized protein LOC141537835 [Cotesia typhae]|uniref:uncharacterized protein LOC141537835 n=1 Tax=Cotesia typhae TaxID=2053667 RepID=UPI003D69F635